MEFQYVSKIATPVQNRIEEVSTPSEQPVNSGVKVNPVAQNPGNRTWSSLFPIDGMDLSNGGNQGENRGNIKITFEGIKMEVDYWTNAVICHVLGANPPLQIMEGFIKRVWGRLGIDRIALLYKGLFIVRFHTFENRLKVLNDGIPMFDKKPVVVRPWAADIDVKSIDVSTAPIWVRLVDLDLKYWVQQTLMKLASALGKPIKTDRATAMRELLSYARILVEVSTEEEIQEIISFETEWGTIRHIEVKYEWKPIKCKKCSMFGHETEDCKMGQPRRVWQSKKTTEGTVQGQSSRPGKDSVQESTDNESESVDLEGDGIGDDAVIVYEHNNGDMDGTAAATHTGTSTGTSSGRGNEDTDSQNAARGGILPVHNE